VPRQKHEPKKIKLIRQLYSLDDSSVRKRRKKAGNSKKQAASSQKLPDELIMIAPKRVQV
jgi:hypothetical protein